MDDNKRIRAHKVALAPASKLFRDMFKNYDEETEYQVIHIRGISSKLIVPMVDLAYEGQTQVDEKEKDDFLTTLKQYKILKVQTTDETGKTRCNFFNREYCKIGSQCVFDHPNEDCETHQMGEVCTDRACRKNTD